jgi:hypothetical protein
MKKHVIIFGRDIVGDLHKQITELYYMGLQENLQTVSSDNN